MNKKFVTPGLLEWNADAFHFTANSLNDFTLNNQRILTTNDEPTFLSLAPIGSSPNADAATLNSNVLNLQPASSSFGGVVTTEAQTFTGLKTFSSGISAPGLITGFSNIGSSPNASGGSVSGSNLVLQPASNSFGGLVTTGSQTFAGLKTFQDGISAPGLISGFSAIGSTPNANGGSVSGSNLVLQPASNSFGGLVTTGSQTFAGLKTFQDGVSAPGLITGVTTIGSSPNANGSSVSGSNLVLQPASNSFGGLVTTGSQTFAGLKTFQDGISAPGVITGVTTIGSTPNANGASVSGSNLVLQPASNSFGGLVTTGSQTLGGVKTFPSGIYSGPATTPYPGLITIGQGLFNSYARYTCTASINATHVTSIVQNGNTITNGNISLFVEIIGNIVTVTIPYLTITATSTPGPEWDMISITPGLPGNNANAFFSAVVFGYDNTNSNKSTPTHVGLDSLGANATIEFYTPDLTNFGLVYGIFGAQNFSYPVNAY